MNNHVQKLSYQTQYELMKLLLYVIRGMKRVQKCFQYFYQIFPKNQEKLLFDSISFKETLLTWKQVQKLLQIHKTTLNREEAIDLILIMGGNVDGVDFITFTEFLKTDQQQLKDDNTFFEVEETFAKLLSEVQFLNLEKSLEPLKEQLHKRWDYSDYGAYNVIARKEQITFSKMKQFFTRLKTPDDDIIHIFRRLSVPTSESISYGNFVQLILPINVRVKSAVDEWISRTFKPTKDTSPSREKITKLKTQNSRNLIKPDKPNYLDRYREARSQEKSPQQKMKDNFNHKSSLLLHESRDKESKNQQKTAYEILQPQGQQSSMIVKLNNLISEQIRKNNSSKKDQGEIRTVRMPQPQNQIDDSKNELKLTFGQPEILVLSQSYIQQYSPSSDQKTQSNSHDVTLSKSQIQGDCVQKEKILKDFAVFLIHLSQLADENKKILYLLNSPILKIISEIQERTWESFWDAQKVQEFFLKNQSKADFLQFVDQFQVSPVQCYQQLSGSIIQVQEIFDQMKRFQMQLRQYKLDLFQRKECSFIWLFEELDIKQKGFLNITDFLIVISQFKLDKDANIILVNLSRIFGGDIVNFQQFLKFMTP